MWSAAHCRDYFMGMMMSTQRAESLNAHFKDRGKQGHKITEFLKHFFNDLNKLRIEACESQHEQSPPAQPTYRGPLHKLVKHVDEVYSGNIYVKVLKEIEEEQGLSVVDIGKEDSVTSYTFGKFGQLDGQRWCVKIDVAQNTFYCDCQMLESMGLPCRHLFSAFKHSNIMNIPPQCIRERWTKAIGHQLLEHIPNLFYVEDPQRQRFMQIYKESLSLALSASQTETGTRSTVKRIRRAAKYVEVDPSARSETIDIDGLSGELRDIRDPDRLSQNFGVSNPQKSRSKGAPPNKLQKCGKCGVPGHKIGSCSKESSKGSGKSTSQSNQDTQNKDNEGLPPDPSL